MKRRFQRISHRVWRIAAIAFAAGTGASPVFGATPSNCVFTGARLERLDVYGRWDAGQLQGRPSLWIFFQPDCAHCVAQFRDLGCLSEDVMTVAVGTRARRDSLAAEVRRFKFGGVAVMASPKMEEVLALSATPTIYILDDRGEIRRKFVGRIPCTELHAALAKRGAKDVSP